MAEITVKLVMDKLIRLVKGEDFNNENVHSQITSIKSELALIQAYIKDADIKAEMLDTSDLQREWVGQLREFACRIEDVIDIYMFEVAKQNQNRGFVRKLQKAIHWDKTIASHKRITSLVKDIKESEIQLKRAKKIVEFNPCIPRACKDGAGTSAQHELQLSSPFIEDEKLVGVDHVKTLLTDWLLKGDHCLIVISVVGEGGLGKTTIVNSIYNQQKKKNSFDCQAWITMSRSLNGEHLLKAMIQSFYEEENDKYAAMEISGRVREKDVLIRKLKQHLHGRSYLIVIDDVWEIDSWEGIKYEFPTDSHNRIIITTRNREVANSCQSFARVKIHLLQRLEKNDALKLLLLKVFPFGLEDRTEELMELARKLVDKSDGVPFAIVAISNILLTKDRNAHEWQKVHDSLDSKFSSAPYLSSYYKALSESYCDLPYHLRPFFLFFGLFAKNSSTSCSDLFQMWISEGFIKEKETKHRTLEAIANEYLDALIHRSLVKSFNPYLHERARSCGVHYLMHVFILDKCKEMNFCKVAEEEDGLQTWTRRLAIHNMNEGVVIGSITNYNPVRSCIACGVEVLPTEIVKSIFSNFKLLVTLNFKDSALEYLPEEVGKLFNLQYLNLKRTKITAIPKSIENLEKLQSLNLKDTQVYELSIKFDKLIKLRHLKSYPSDPFPQPKSWIGVKLNERIQHLTALQTLVKVDTTDDEDGTGVIHDLLNLEWMKRLAIIIRGKNGNHVCNAVNKMEHLDSLAIQAPPVHGVLELQSLTRLPPHLRRLYLLGSLERLPDWIPKLNNLVKLTLSWSSLVENPLFLLRGLPKLSELVLCNAYKGKALHFHEGWFMKLEKLTLESMPILETVEIDEGALKRLEQLELGPLPQMVKAPIGIQNLEALKDVYLYDMLDEFVPDIEIKLKENTKLHKFKDE